MKRVLRSNPSGSRSALHSQVLVILFLTLFGGGSAVDIAEVTRSVIHNDSRAAAASATAAAIDLELAAARRDVLDFRGELFRLLAPYETDPAERRTASEVFDTRMWKRQERLLALRDELRGAMTPAEWEELFDALRKAGEGR